MRHRTHDLGFPSGACHQLLDATGACLTNNSLSGERLKANRPRLQPPGHKGPSGPIALAALPGGRVLERRAHIIQYSALELLPHLPAALLQLPSTRRTAGSTCRPSSGPPAGLSYTAEPAAVVTLWHIVSTPGGVKGPLQSGQPVNPATLGAERLGAVSP